MKLEEHSPEKAESLMLKIRAIRHDLGRYICFEQRFVENVEDVEELRMALRSDLLSTRKKGAEIDSCSVLWQELRPNELDADPDICAIDHAIEDIQTLDLNGPMEELQRAQRLAECVRDACRRLMQRSLAFNEGESVGLPGGGENG